MSLKLNHRHDRVFFLGCLLRNLFLVTNATDIAWAASVADGVRESVLAEAAAVEEESGRNGGGGEQDVANGMATLSVTVSEWWQHFCTIIGVRFVSSRELHAIQAFLVVLSGGVMTRMGG